MYKFTNKRHSREICSWTLDSGKIESVVEIIEKLSRCCGKVESASQIIGKSARADRIEDFAISICDNYKAPLDIQGQRFHNMIFKIKHQRG